MLMLTGNKICKSYIFQVYKCHKIMLVRLSPVFEELIKTCEDTDEEDCCVTISSFQTNLFELILKYVLASTIFQ